MARSRGSKVVGNGEGTESSGKQLVIDRPLFLTPREAADELGIGVDELLRLKLRGKAPESTEVVGSTMYYYVSVMAHRAA